MIRLAHHCMHVPYDPEPVLAALQQPTEVWLGGTPIGHNRVALTLQPAGLGPQPAEPAAVLLDVGPSSMTGRSVLRRLAFELPGIVPVTRCDLSATACLGHGVRFRVQAEFRSTGSLLDEQAQMEGVEAILQPLVQCVATRLDPVEAMAG